MIWRIKEKKCYINNIIMHQSIASSNEENNIALLSKTKKIAPEFNP